MTKSQLIGIVAKKAHLTKKASEELSQEAQKILSEQKLLHKIHRTRTDKRWRKYK